jgi:hypothetical protein
MAKATRQRGFEYFGVADHQERWLAAFARQLGKDVVEHAKPTPLHDRL